MLKDYANKTNEELVALYVNEGNEKAIEALLKNTEGLRVSLANKFSESIPGMDFDDLMQEGAMVMLNKLSVYNPEKVSFTSFLYMVIENRYKNIYKSVTCRKRNLFDEVSVDDDSNGDDSFSSDRGSLYLSVECEEYERVELLNLIDSLNLSNKERIVARFLAYGWDKAGIAEETNMSNSQVCVLSKRIGKKMILAGAVV